jgi:hypothetical protein
MLLLLMLLLLPTSNPKLLETGLLSATSEKEDLLRDPRST